MTDIKIYLLALLVLFLGACDSFLDVNQDPARISPDEVAPETLLPSGIQYTAQSFFGAAQYGSQYPQYLSGHAISQYTPYGFDQLWRPLYTDAFPTLEALIDQAEELGAYNYSGIAKVMLGLNIMMAADIYGDVPYSEANQGPDEIYPCYDSMQEIYEVHLRALFDEAIEDLQQPLPDEAVLQTVQNDYIYAGDTDQWLKAAYAARARYHLHLAQQNPELLAAAVEDAQQAFESNADDLELLYEDQSPNPWFTFLGNATDKIMRPSSYLVNLMNGTGHYAGLEDPRLPQYMDNAGAANYVGKTPGMLIGQESAVNVDLTPDVWFSTETAPLQMLTYAEVQFILAEAQFETDSAAAYEAYLEGIRASMQKVGVASDEIDAYIDDPQISTGADELTLADIMLQKYIALYLQIEGWTDLRRYQFDPDVYPGLEKPVQNQIPGDPWAQRSNIADDEPGVNTCLPDIPDQGTILWLFDN